MDWWQAGSVMGTVVLATTAVVTISWRVLAGMRQENRAAHDKIGEKITQVRTEVAQVRDGQAAMREGIGEIRGELRGVRHSLETLRGDFRAHVFGQQD